MVGLSRDANVVSMRYESSAGNQPAAHPAAPSLRTPTTVDLVVPVYNEEASLAVSIETLLAADTGRGIEVTIIIADNASTDSTRESPQR